MSYKTVYKIIKLELRLRMSIFIHFFFFFWKIEYNKRKYARKQNDMFNCKCSHFS